MKLTQNQKQNLWNKFTNKFFNTHNYPTRRKFYNSVWSILFGIILILISISIFKYNPFDVFFSFFTSSNNSDIFIPTIVSFVFAALAISICFKAGIFNIGISGQMMLSGFISLYILRSAIQNNGEITHLNVIASILLSIVIGIAASLVIGLLKAYLGVNEVVSSIMINWIIFFIIRYVVKMNDDGFLSTSSLYNSGLTESYGEYLPELYYIEYENWISSSWSWILIIFAFIAVLTIWVIMRFTKFGYKVKMVGLSNTASDYSGTNKRSLILIAMTISGFLSSIAGFVWYFSTQNGSIDISISSGPLAAGFTAIAISLIVYDNPIAILFSSVLFSIILVGAKQSPDYPELPREMVDVVSGLFVLSAAISFVFSKFLPYQWMKNFLIFIRDKRYRKNYWKNWSITFEYLFGWFYEKKKLINLWTRNHKEWNRIKKEFKHKEREEEKKLSIEIKNDKSTKNKFIFSKLNNDKQIEYLEFLSKLKKEKDIELSKAHYFDKTIIKSERIEKYNSWKHKYNDIKKSILDKYYNIIEEKLVATTQELASKEQERFDQKSKKKGDE